MMQLLWSAHKTQSLISELLKKTTYKEKGVRMRVERGGR